MRWETVVKRKNMRDVYKRFIDEIIEETTEPISAKQIHGILYDKFETYRAAQSRIVSNRDFPEPRSIVYYLKIAHTPTDSGAAGIHLYGGNK